MQAGKLNHFIAVERLQHVPDGMGGSETQWVLVCKLWAQVEALSGREYFAAQQVQSEANYRLTIRHRADLTPADRITHESRMLDIVHIGDPDGQRERLVIYAKG